MSAGHRSTQHSILAFFHHATFAGPPKHLYPWFRSLSRDGELVIAVPARGSLTEAYGDIAQVAVIPYRPLTVPHGVIALVGFPLRFVWDVTLALRAVRRERPNIVVVVTAVLPAELLAARLAGVPTVLYAAELLDVADGRHMRRMFAKLALALSGLLASSIVCCSDAVARQFPRPRARGTAVTIFPGIPDSPRIGDAARFRAQHRIGDDLKPWIAVVGNISAGRGQDLAIEALAFLREEMPNASLLIVGEPHARAVDRAFADGLRGLARDLGVDQAVHFVGHVANVEDVFAAVDVVVNPARVPEAFGRVALEALAAGTPVVATSVGAVPDILESDVDALLILPDARALANAVSRLIQDPILAQDLVLHAQRHIATRYREDVAVERFRDVIRRVSAAGR